MREADAQKDSEKVDYNVGREDGSGAGTFVGGRMTKFDDPLPWNVDALYSVRHAM